MAKKYLSIEEAAERLGVNADDLKRLRERGEIRAFADRGTWKFREDDIDELARKSQADSDPEVPIVRASPPAPKKKDDLANIVLFGDDDDSGDDAGGSSLDLGSETDSALGEQPTIVRKNRDNLAASDSDVRLVFDDSLLPDEEIDLLMPSDDMQHSDSDVRLISPGTGSDEGSDSDVKLVPDSSSVRSGRGSGSDSDVTLVGADNDSFSLDLDESDGSFILGGESSGIALSDSGIEGGSGIMLELPNDSGIALESDGSGISLEPDDSGISLDLGGDSGISLDAGESGISLDSDDSGLVLAGDSGISLLGPSDSGIALEGLSGGPSKKKAADKKAPAKKGKVDLGSTMPEIPLMSAHDDDMGATQMEVPMLSGDDADSEFEFTASSLDEDSSASVVMLGDDDALTGKAAAGKKGGKKKRDDEDSFDTAATSEFGSSDVLDATDSFDSSGEFDASADDMEVSDDVIGEDDEISEDVFGAGDEDFDEELTSGSSSAEFVAAPVGGPARMAMPIQAEWGGGTFFMLFLSSSVMLLTSFLMYDVVRTMWGNNEPTAGTEMILSSFRGMFG
jgi:excisionase family DNA binding protein